MKTNIAQNRRKEPLTFSNLILPNIRKTNKTELQNTGYPFNLANFQIVVTGFTSFSLTSIKMTAIFLNA